MDTAVILAGGRGLRFLPSGEDLPKPMTEVHGRPILHYILQLLHDLQIKKVMMVVGFKKERIIERFGSGSAYGMQIEYVDNPYIDHKPKSGLSDALLLLKDKIFQPFMMILGDEVYRNTRHAQMMSFYKENITAYDAAIAVCRTDEPEEIKKNYAVKMDRNGMVSDLEEKPRQVWNDFIGCGTFLFKPSVFHFLEQTPLSERSGRKELADTLKLMILHKKKVRAYDIGGQYLNINYPKDLERAREMLRGQKIEDGR